MGWISKLIFLGIAGYAGYGVYTYHRAGYFDLPELEDGSYLVSFNNGLRGIVLDAEVADNGHADAPAILRGLSQANPKRRYIGVPFDVAPWFKDVWSTCLAPDSNMVEYFESIMPDQMKQDLIGARLDAACFIDLEDGGKIARGLIYSVPRS